MKLKIRDFHDIIDDKQLNVKVSDNSHVRLKFCASYNL